MKIQCSNCKGNFNVTEEHYAESGVDCPYCDTHIEGEINGDDLIEPAREEKAELVESDTAEELEIVVESAGKPLGVRFLALAIGLLGLLTGGRFLFQLLHGTINGPVLYPAYYAIGISFVITFIMLNLFFFREWARIVTIILSTISILVSGWALFQIAYYDLDAPLRVIVNYSIRILFCFYFIIYLMIPQVKSAFFRENKKGVG